MNKPEESLQITKNAIERLLGLLEKQDSNTNPMERMAELYVLKALLQKASVAKVAMFCIKRNLFEKIVPRILSVEFSPYDTHNKLALYSLAMKIVWLFSGTDQPIRGHLSDLPMLKEVAAFLDMKNRFYQFSPLFSRKLRKLCQNTCFLHQKVTTVPITDEIWKDILFYKPCMKVLGKVSEIHCCSLNVTKSSQVPSIAETLIKSRLAWRTFHKDPADPIIQHIKELTQPTDSLKVGQRLVLSDDEEEKKGENPQCIYDDIYALDLIGGHYFWAYIGSKPLEVAQSVSDLLLEELPNLQPCRPQIDDLVAAAIIDVESDDPEKPNVVRGKVFEVEKDLVWVIALDYGGIKSVASTNVYELPSHTNLSTLVPQAKICCLAGVQAPPADESTVELALCTFTNLTKLFVNPGFTLKNAGCIEQLLMLIKCGPPNIQLQATRLLVNISSISRISKDCIWTPFIRPLLEAVVVLSCQESLSSTNKEIMSASLFALTNILYLKSSYQQMFFEFHGHQIVMNTMRLLNAMRLIKQHSNMLRATACVLRAAYPGLIRHIEALSCGMSASECAASKEVEDEPTLGAAATESRSHHTEDFSEEEVNFLLQNMKQQEDADNVDESTPPQQLFADLQVDDALIDLSGSDTDIPGDSRDASEEGKDAGSKVPVEFVPVDGASIMRNRGSFYVNSSRVEYRDDMTHHLVDVEDINCISRSKLAELICGMINSRGGTIYVGITKDGFVRGLRLSRDDRDSVRLGVDHIMTGCSPHLTHADLHVNYAQVVDSAESRTPCKDRFVIEIRTKANRQLGYHIFGNPGVIYQRYGCNTRLLREQEVRQMIVLEEEAKYLPEILELRRKIAELKKGLGEA